MRGATPCASDSNREGPAEPDFARAWAALVAEVVRRLTPAERWAAQVQAARERFRRGIERQGW